MFARSPGEGVLGALLLLAACGAAQSSRTERPPLDPKNGIVLVFNPASCSAHSSIFPLLARIDSLPGVTVIGLMTATPTEAEVTEIRQAYGIAFELRTISPAEMSRYKTGVPLGGPIAWVFRRGTAESILGVATMERLGFNLSNLFGAGK